MKIVDMEVRTVAIPTTCQLRHNTGVHPEPATGANEKIVSTASWRKPRRS